MKKWVLRRCGFHGKARDDHLVQLGDEVGGFWRGAADLAEGEGEEQRRQKVGDAVVQVGVHQMTPPPLHQVHDRRPCAQKA